jgi:pSer/pThr/pTyr-binding forkhead associated (FHA) protein
MPFLDNGTSSIEVTPGDLLVGSGAQATWRVVNADLAARHFTIKVAPDGSATLKPYSASTIVVVNGVPATQGGTPIKVGDVIAAGSTRFFVTKDLEEPRPDFNAPARKPAFLVDEAERRAYPMAKRTISIGRDVGAGIPLRDPSVSRFHADVRSEAGEFVLYSMGSAGTHVNDQRVAAPKMLEEGDRIRIGDTTFKFTREALGQGITVAKLGEGEEDALARRSTVTLRTVKHGSPNEDTGDNMRAGNPERPRMVAVMLGTAALVAAAAWFIFGRG